MTRKIPASLPTRRRTVLGAALLASAALGIGLLSGCSAGQITQTDTQVAPVAGISAQSADGLITLRQGVVAYSDVYKTGSVVPIEVRLFNNAKQAAKLTGVTAGSAGSVVLVGGPSAAASPSASPSASASASASASPSKSASKSASSSPSASASPSASPSASASPTPTAAGSSTISVDIPVGGFVSLSQATKTYLAVQKLSGEELRAGAALSDVTFTFTYADGSTTTIKLPQLPMTVPLSPLPKPSSVVRQEGE